MIAYCTVNVTVFEVLTWCVWSGGGVVNELPPPHPFIAPTPNTRATSRLKDNQIPFFAILRRTRRSGSNRNGSTTNPEAAPGSVSVNTIVI